jgi:DNA-binding SARP family transcriptional activator
VGGSNLAVDATHLRAQQPPLEFLVLGPVEVRRGTHVLPLGGPRQRALLALLLIERGRAVSVDRVADELWAGEPPDGAAVTLRSYVSRLRKVLGDGARLSGTQAAYVLRTDGAHLDSADFENAVRDADAKIRGGAIKAAAEELRGALDLWRGRPFGELASDGALAIEADRLLELRLHALEARVDADIALGQSAELIDEIEALARQYPFRERLWRSLMLALFHAERQADALAAYHRARTTLDEQLGIEPSHELQALERAIRGRQISPISPAT